MEFILISFGLVAALVAVAVPPAVAKAAGLYREYEAARIPDYDPDPIFPWIRDNLHEPGMLLARDSVNNVEKIIIADPLSLPKTNGITTTDFIVRVRGRRA